MFICGHCDAQGFCPTTSPHPSSQFTHYVDAPPILHIRNRDQVRTSTSTKEPKKGGRYSTTTYIDRSKHTYLSHVKIAVLKADSTKVAQLSSKNWIVEWDKNIVFNPSTLAGKRVILLKIERKNPY